MITRLPNDASSTRVWLRPAEVPTKARSRRRAKQFSSPQKRLSKTRKTGRPAPLESKEFLAYMAARQNAPLCAFEKQLRLHAGHLRHLSLHAKKYGEAAYLWASPSQQRQALLFHNSWRYVPD